MFKPMETEMYETRRKLNTLMACVA